MYTADRAGERLDKYLARTMAAYSRSAVQRLITEERVQVNHLPAKASHRLELGDVIEIDLPEAKPHTPAMTDIPLDLLYEDDDLVVINKPAGVVVHPAPGHETDTLVNALVARYPALAKLGGDRPGIVHRLDRDTSGVLVVAKSVASQRALQRQFKRRQVGKLYLALLLGQLTPDHGIIEAPIGRDPNHRQRMAVVSQGGRPARTSYQVLEHIHSARLRQDFTYAQLTLETGRTHQIRVHLHAIGYPIMGDRVYGQGNQLPGLTRQFLHAWQLTFALPSSGETRTFTAPLPAELGAVLAELED